MRELKKLLDDMISTLRVTVKRNEHRGKKEGWLRSWSPGEVARTQGGSESPRKSE